MILNNKKILITGANGFIGINLINKLNKHDKNIYTIIEPGTEIEKIKNIKHRFICVTDKQSIKKYILQVSPDIIIHLAAYINNDMSPENVKKSTGINVGGTLNLLDCAASLLKKPKFIFISTGEVYGAHSSPARETSKCKPLSVYSITKFSAEDLCRKYHDKFGLPVLIVRPSLVYGPHQKEKMFIPSLISSLLKGKSFDMTQGEQLRDFIYVEDFTDALSALVKKDKQGLFNISYGASVEIKKIAVMVKKIIKSKAVLNIGAIPYRKNEIWNYGLDNTKIKKEIMWKPKYKIEEGLKKTINWYRKHYAA